MITGVRREMLPRGGYTVSAGREVLERVVPYYAQAAEGEVVALINSAGNLELAVHGKLAADATGLPRGGALETRLR